MKRLISWEPFVTERGYTGLSREHCRVGDEIWLIGGCIEPVLLSSETGNAGDFGVNGEARSFLTVLCSAKQGRYLILCPYSASP